MRNVVALVGALLVFLTPAALGAEPQWTTYHHDAARSGVDPEDTQPSKPVQLWESQPLDGLMAAEPLIYGSYVYVATENDTIYAIDAESGKIAWEKHLATPVPSSELACSGIAPVVGITSTPVIDPATHTIYAVEDTWDGESRSSISHKLVALDTQTGESRPNFPLNVDPNYPPGGSARNQLQRPALALDGNEIVIGYGSDGADCETYWGWLVAAPKSGSGANQQFQVESDEGHHGGAIWESGNGPAVDSAGRIYAATGNGFSGGTFNFADSVLEFEPDLNLIEYWAPADWFALDENDEDLGSSGPILLPHELAFEIGKSGEGVMLRRGAFGGVGGRPAASLPICGSWGGGIYVPDGAESGTLYVTCLASGVRPVEVSELGASEPKMSLVAGWNAPRNTIGPPIFAGGLVWSTNYISALGDAVLYGLGPCGQVEYEENEEPFAHFATPSAGGGRLFVANGTHLTAISLTEPQPEPPPPCEEQPVGGGPSGASSGASTSSSSGSTGGGATGAKKAAPRRSAPIAGLVHRQLRVSDGARRAKLTLRCPSTTTPCAGVVRLVVQRPDTQRGGRPRSEPVRIALVSEHFGPSRGVFTVALRLDTSARTLLAHRRSRDSKLLVEISSSKGKKRYSVSAT